jgi:hypothetical protein
MGDRYDAMRVSRNQFLVHDERVDVTQLLMRKRARERADDSETVALPQADRPFVGGRPD